MGYLSCFQVCLPSYNCRKLAKIHPTMPPEGGHETILHGVVWRLGPDIAFRLLLVSYEFLPVICYLFCLGSRGLVGPGDGISSRRPLLVQPPSP